MEIIIANPWIFRPEVAKMYVLIIFVIIFIKKVQH